MLLYRAPSAAASAPPSPPGSEAASLQQQNKAWALKSVASGVSVLGLAYCLVQALQVAGVQYLATLASVSLLAFLLVYLLWCAASKKRPAPSRHGCVESGGAECACAVPSGVVGGGTGAVPSCSAAVAAQEAALLRSLAALYAKRPPTPPPSYEEAVRLQPPPAAHAA